MTNPLDINFPNVGLNAYLLERSPLDPARSRTFTLDTGKSTLMEYFWSILHFLSRKVVTDNARRVNSNDGVISQQYFFLLEIES